MIQELSLVMEAESLLRFCGFNDLEIYSFINNVSILIKD